MLVNDNSLKNLLAVIEPKIQNIEEHRIECSSLKSVRDTMMELVELGNSSYKEILNFYDQEFIFKAIKIGNLNPDTLIDKYKSSKYLLSNDKLEYLPQFKESLTFMEQLHEYLYGLNEKIKLEYDTKFENLKVEEILNKYYNLLNKDDIFIKDINGFFEFLDLNDLNINDRLNILILINKANVKKYITTNNIDIGNKINLSEIKEMLDKNKDLINIDFDNKNQDLKLDLYLEKNKDNLDSSINSRKIYLINKINDYYHNKMYSSIINLYKELEIVLKLEDEFNKQKKSSKKFMFLFKNSKSLVRDYLDKTSSKYRSCVLKNLLDLETNNSLNLPKMCYNNIYLYVKDDFVVKTVYTYMNNYILILGVLDKGEKLEVFVKQNEYIINEMINNQDDLLYDDTERDLILKNINLEDLVVSIDLDTLDVKVEEENGR